MKEMIYSTHQEQATPSEQKAKDSTLVRETVFALLEKYLPNICKKYCFDNYRQFQCTLDSNWGVFDSSVAFCEWGNALYAWSLEDLIGKDRSLALGDQPSKLAITKYFSKILFSVPFMERFKDWRFRRRIRVPAYIKAIDPDAYKVFWYLIDQADMESITQRIGRTIDDIACITKRIKQELMKRNKSHLLHQTTILSLTQIQQIDESASIFLELPSLETTTIKQIEQRDIHHAYQKLDWLEQYIIDAMVIDELKATSVLQVLKQQAICLNDTVQPESMNTQHIYYFLRKTLAKLKSLHKQLSQSSKEVTP
ncbi:MAG: hypothetical protein OEY38_16540 [Gammaproteobacteria bacterium]|nr:hypothetical protein [Gammaproteobacteria bacterium]